jgi:glycosyltransferase involved in cell wall biosynthesis
VKILYVDQTGQLGGGELSLLDLIRTSPFEAEVALFADGPFREALELRGVRVHLLLGGSVGGIRREAGIGSILGAGPALLGLRSRLARLAKGFDVLYANSQKAFLLCALARRRGQPLIWHLRDMLTADHFSPTLRKIAVTVGNHAASVVIGNSQATADSFIQSGGHPDKIVVVYNGISSDAFDTVTEEEVARTRRELELTGKFLVGVFGRLSPWKGQHILLEAVASLPDVHAVLIGDALFGEDAYVEMLRARAACSDLAGRVHFLGFRRDVATLLKCMDIVAHTSTSPEPFGRVIVEGMLACRPVIATRAGGAMEILNDGETGLLVGTGSVLELGDAIVRLRSDLVLAHRLASAGRTKAVTDFSVSTMAAGITKVITGLQSPVCRTASCSSQPKR